MNEKVDAKKIAEGIILAFENNPDGRLSLEGAKSLVDALGGSAKAAEQCNHDGSLCLYISALIVRNDRSSK